MEPAADPRPPVVVVTGPTASGKTSLAIEIARRFGGEIINADSMQVYRFMDIGTAKPTPEQRSEIPHHLIDVVTPSQDYNAGRYALEARRAAADIQARGKLVVLTGGTGLYIRAFLEGLLAAGESDPELRERLEREHASAVEAGDPERLHRELEERDAAAAAKIHPHDVRRVVRALEIAFRTGAPASQLRDAHGFGDQPYAKLHIALDPGRDRLNERIDARCREMIDAGLLREARLLRELGYGPELRPMQAIGYRHMTPVVDGADTLVHALEVMQRDTRRFARRQRTWLRAIDDVVWLKPDDATTVEATVEEFLKDGRRPNPVQTQ